MIKFPSESACRKTYEKAESVWNLIYDYNIGLEPENYFSVELFNPESELDFVTVYKKAAEEVLTNAKQYIKTVPKTILSKCENA